MNINPLGRHSPLTCVHRFTHSSTRHPRPSRAYPPCAGQARQVGCANSNHPVSASELPTHRACSADPLHIATRLPVEPMHASSRLARSAESSQLLKQQLISHVGLSRELCVRDPPASPLAYVLQFLPTAHALTVITGRFRTLNGDHACTSPSSQPDVTLNAQRRAGEPCVLPEVLRTQPFDTQIALMDSN